MSAPDRATPEYTPEQMAEARGWVSDCMWREDPDEIEAMSDAEIMRGVERHHAGGWSGLVRNAGLDMELEQ